MSKHHRIGQAVLQQQERIYFLLIYNVWFVCLDWCMKRINHTRFEWNHIWFLVNSWGGFLFIFNFEIWTQIDCNSTDFWSKTLFCGVITTLTPNSNNFPLGTAICTLSPFLVLLKSKEQNNWISDKEPRPLIETDVSLLLIVMHVSF